MTRRRRCDRRGRQKLQLGFPAGSSVRNTPPTEVIATVTSLAELNRILVNSDVPAPEVNKALTFAIHMRRTRGVIKFVERELT